MNCGHEIQNGELYCRYCGKEVRIVPDYNPLDEVLAAQVKGGIDGSERPLDDYDFEESRTADMRRGDPQRQAGRRKKGNHTRNTEHGGSGSAAHRSRRTQNQRQDTQSRRHHQTSRLSSVPEEERERRRRAAAKRRRKKKKLRRRIFLTFLLLVILAAAAAFLLYQNSYAGQVGKGDRAYQAKEYDEAEKYYKKAIGKNPEKGEAYTGLYKVYLARDDEDSADQMFEDALKKYDDAVPVYRSCIAYYMDTDQPQEVSYILKDAPKAVRSELGKYISEGPSFSLDDSKTYDDVQQLTLKSDGEAIYYTTDGSDPSTSSQKYSKPIQIEEGKTTISAISVNKEGIPSLPVIKKYEVELPIVDAPAVTPSTGQYEKATQITIQVPEGYTAYYTMDRTDPTEESTKYTGPVNMPEGSTIFKAVLIDGKGRTTGITTRNYELTLS